MQKLSNTHIIVGMSGGVDSSVTALLLKQQGYRVSGIFMHNWQTDNDDPHCPLQQDLLDAKNVCEKIDIPLSVVNFSSQYWDKVFHYFLDEYAAGRTPNPDIMCNKEIKFKAFLEYAKNQGAHFIATGHYARINKHNDNYQLLKGSDDNKDQSYFLYTLGQQQLANSLFPIGDLTKPQVRAIAAQAGFVNHAKKDSTGICFIGERKFKTFLHEYLLAQPGAIETPEGKIIGKHDGLMFYTIGQRQGIGIGGTKGANDEPWYVMAKDTLRNVLIVGQGHNHPLLMKDSLQCTQLYWVAGQAPGTAFHACAKIRYRQNEQPCTVTYLDHDRYAVKFAEPQRAITAGQSIVFYQGEVCLGGGIIL